MGIILMKTFSTWETAMMQITFFSLKRSTILLAVLAAFSTPSLALQPLITDDTGTVGAGSNSLEISYNRDRTRIGKTVEEDENGDLVSVPAETERAYSVPVVYTRGLTDTLDVYAQIEHVRLRPADHEGRASGLGNTVIGAKWRFFENEDSGTSLAVKPEVLIPVSAQREEDGLGNGKTSGGLTFILSQDVPFGSVHFNAGVARDRFRNSEDNPSATTRHFSIAPVWNVSEQWTLALDVGVDRVRSGGDTVRSKYAEIGAIYAPSEEIELAFGLIRATDNDHPKSKTHGLTVGLTWHF
jgi:hypothetical protein